MNLSRDSSGFGLMDMVVRKPAPKPKPAGGSGGSGGAGSAAGAAGAGGKDFVACDSEMGDDLLL